MVFQGRQYGKVKRNKIPDMFPNVYGDGRDQFNFQKRVQGDLMGNLFGDMVVGDEDSW